MLIEGKRLERFEKVQTTAATRNLPAKVERFLKDMKRSQEVCEQLGRDFHLTVSQWNYLTYIEQDILRAG